MMFLDSASQAPLVSQIVAGISLAIKQQQLRPGSKLPSIRKLSQSHKVSHFTVVEAYDRLVAAGLLKAVPNAGFFVRELADSVICAPPVRMICSGWAAIRLSASFSTSLARSFALPLAMP